MPKIILAAHGRITTHFHQDIGRGFLHRGIDQGHGGGTPYDLQIMAPADGTVTFAGPFGSYGNVLFITHTDGCVSVLAHHARQFVTKGARVKQGQIIAVMGNTGTVFVHNHQEYRSAAGVQLDPLLHLGASTASTGTTTPLPIGLLARKKHSMSTGFFTTRNGVMEWALAGDGQGDAAWIPVGNDAAQALAAVHGNFVELTAASFDSFKARYLSGGQVVNQTVNTTTDPTALAKILAAVNALPVGIAAENARRVAS